MFQQVLLGSQTNTGSCKIQMYGEKYSGRTSSLTESVAHCKYCHYEAKFKKRAVMVKLQNAITSKFHNVATTEWVGLELKIHPLKGKK